jgi:hypothetical protein
MVGIQIYISLINTFLKFLYKNKMAGRHLGDAFCLSLSNAFPKIAGKDAFLKITYDIPSHATPSLCNSLPTT